MKRAGFLKIATLIGAFTFLLISSLICYGAAPASYPNITVVRDIDDTKNIKTISMAGGEKILLKGLGFVANAKVYFVPILKRYSPSSTETVSNVVYTPASGNSSETWTIESSTAATTVNVLSSTKMEVTVPAGPLFKEGVMVVNPDGGASEIYYDLTYDFARPNYPLNVKAKRIKDSSGDHDLAIRISWDSVPNATGYEVYSVDSGEYYYIASTNLTSYTYTDITNSTDYRFAVKATVNCGVSYPSETSAVITTSNNIGTYNTQFYPDVDAATVRNGNQALLDLSNITYYPQYLQMDLTQGDLKGCREAVINLPLSVITGRYPYQIRIDGNGYKIKFSPAVFNSKQVRNYNQYKAGVQFRITEVKTNSYGLTAGKALSPIFHLEANIKCDGKSIPIRKLEGFIDLSVACSTGNKALPTAGTPWLYIYDPVGEDWNIITNYGMNVGNMWSGKVDSMGYYKIIAR